MAPAPLPLIVIGASAGGLDALAAVLNGVSREIPAPILAVIHIGASDAQLPRFYDRRSPLPVRYGIHGEHAEPGTVYLAPPDRHLLIDNGQLQLGNGPRENHTRPAIDPLFRSAAVAAGTGVAGVILTGHLTDGTAGLWEVKRKGGTAIVQDPAEAVAPSMPRSALLHVDVDHCLKLNDIGPTLNEWAKGAARKAPSPPSAHGGADMEYKAEQPFALTCPDCGGAVRPVAKGTYTQFTCHIGHTFGIPELAEQQLELIESTLSHSLRLLNERKDLCREAAAAARRADREQEARQWETAGQEAEQRFNDLKKLIEANWERPELASNGEAGRKQKKTAPKDTRS